MIFKIGDIVRFNENTKETNTCKAAAWCYDQNITGTIVDIPQHVAIEKNQAVIIDAGLGYSVWTRIDHIDIVARVSEIPEPCDI